MPPQQIGRERPGRLPFERAEQRCKAVAYLCTLGIQRDQKLGPFEESHAVSQARTFVDGGGQDLCLRVADLLQPMLGHAQKSISSDEPSHFACRDQSEFTAHSEHGNNAALTQACFATASDQLEHLADKFDFADAARAALHVVFQAVLRDFGIDQRLHVAHRLQRAEIEIAPEYEGPRDGVQRLEIARITVDHAALDQRIPLPVPPMHLVIVFEGAETGGQCTAVAERAQPHVDAIHEAVCGGVV